MFINTSKSWPRSIKVSLCTFELNLCPYPHSFLTFFGATFCVCDSHENSLNFINPFFWLILSTQVFRQKIYTFTLWTSTHRNNMLNLLALIDNIIILQSSHPANNSTICLDKPIRLQIHTVQFTIFPWLQACPCIRNIQLLSLKLYITHFSCRETQGCLC